MTIVIPDGRRTRALMLGLAVLCAMLVATALRAPAALADCSTAANPVACENQLPGDPPSDWEINGAGDPTIQGFATAMSVNAGDTESFKIKTPSPRYHIDILRLGYYGGNGARKIATLSPSATLPQTQPACLANATTGLIDCGNWSVSATWSVPSTAVSGVYIAHLVRDDSSDPGGDSQIMFVVRNDASHSAVLMSTDDATWEAYNAYGGNSLYTCTVSCPAGSPKAYKAAYAVSYNRPFDGALSTDGGASDFYYAEYQMVRWLERSGYDVSYTSDSQLDGSGALLANHKLFLTAGHDEYWSGGEYQNIKTALSSGLNEAFFTGNEMFWKTRWAASADGSSTPYRTLISYKETHFDAPTDPQDPGTWTGAWGDPRFSPPADGGTPANALTGQEFVVNQGTSDITVPYQYHALRFWRNTSAASLSSGQALTLSPGTGLLGYEWDVMPDNGFQPPGEFPLSSTTVSGLQTFTDYGSTVVGPGASGTTQTHHLSLYRAAGGGLVFGAGTVQWSWGLDNFNAWGNNITDPTGHAPDANVEQATVNLLADMGVQPATLISGLTPAGASTDTSAPSSQISAPSAGASVSDGARTTISGSATDTGGGVVAGVEVSTDGGSSWHFATLTGPAATSVSFSYSWIASGAPSTTIETRAVDDSGNVESPSDQQTLGVTCSCSVFGAQTPRTTDDGDSSSVELGMKFRSSSYGTVTGVRFYKSSLNTGTHVGSLWDASGKLLAQVTFTNESASGWQDASFSSPVTIQPNVTYVVGYLAPKGHYAGDSGWFYPAPSPPPVGGGGFTAPPLSAVANASSTNGVFAYASSPTFPTGTYNAANYWVDVDFSTTPAPGKVTGVGATAGFGSATVSWSAPASGGAATTYTITPYQGSTALPTTTVTGTPPATTATVGGLTQGQSYTFTVQASNPVGAGPTSDPSNAIVPTGTTTPAAPTNVTASPGSARALVSWTAPSSNGNAITGYTVTPYVGSTAQTPTQVNSATATQATVTGLRVGRSYTFTVSATNSAGTGPESAASSAVTPQDTVFDFATPATPDAGDGSAVELGVKFTAQTAGQITGVRFYKSAANTGAHIGSLWSAGGTLLASATFSGETASGWQTVQFSQPVSVNANTTYVAGYYAPSGHYAATGGGLSAAQSNPPLSTVASSTSPDGVYAYGSAPTFPTGSYNATNYWVDVLFTPAAPGKVTGVQATAGAGSATVSWTAPAGGGASSYTVTPSTGAGAQTPVTVSGSATSTTIPGLTAGSSYTFTVHASNDVGDGPESDPSGAVTPTAAAVPDAPTSVAATPAGGRALVSWTRPAANGSPITSYTITPSTGGTAQTPTQVSDASATSATVTGLTVGQPYTFTVTATSAAGTSQASGASAAVTPEDTLLELATPATVDAGDRSGVELGVRFSSSIAGRIMGIRFYKAAANTGTHVGSLWNSGGNLLASATFAGETGSGWQTVLFANPVSVAANTTYVAGYFAPAGHYSATGGAFSGSLTNAPLTAAAGQNGVYAYGSSSQYPTGSYNSTNYWVDVLFDPGSGS